MLRKWAGWTLNIGICIAIGSGLGWVIAGWLLGH